jgi:twitching motility protein PilI
MRKKLSLREFQEYLAKRLTSAARGEVSSAKLGVMSGTEQWLLNLTESGEILPLPPLTPVPLTKPWFAGMANIRGSLDAVVDFSGFRTGELTPRNSNTRLVLIGTRFGVNSAIIVNRMLGLKQTEDFAPAPATGPLPVWVDGILVDQEDRQWRRLNVPALLADPEFVQVGL